MTRATPARRLLRPGLLACGVLAVARLGSADSVVPVAPQVLLAPEAADLIDPAARPGGGAPGTTTAVRVGDVVTLRFRFTTAPNNASRAMNGYATVYVPANVEVVGARFTDRDGNTVPSRRAGLAPDGVGPRGTSAFAAPLLDGSIAQLHADTGIFY